MCGRYTILKSADAVAERFQAGQLLPMELPHFNVAPTNAVPVVTLEMGVRIMQPMQWGLVPPWARDPGISSRLINARSDTLAEKPAFKAALVRKRCLVPADGFFEWRKEPDGRQPYLFRLRDQSMFAFAGLWEEWPSPDGSGLRSCSIITVEPNDLVGGFHTRMPAILPPGDEDAWLAHRDGRNSVVSAQVLPMLKPYPADAMEAVRVSRYVNSVRSTGPGCVEPELGTLW